MKKIFAIALALVMVLSMASAFAFNNCSSPNFAWPCDTEVNYCGKGKVEVVPFVKVNNACNGFDWQANSCAGAVASENIYFAVKVIVDANADVSLNYTGDETLAGFWWDLATLTVEVDETMVTVEDFTAGEMTFDGFEALTEKDADDEYVQIAWDADEAAEYYFTPDETFVPVEDVDTKAEYDAIMFTGEVAENAKIADVEVCATLASEHDGVTGDGEVWVFGDYTVEVGVDYLRVEKGNDWFEYSDNALVDDVEGQYVMASDDEFADEVNKLFKLNGCTLGTCLTETNVQSNFGWDDEFENCAPWSNKAAAVVDAECVVAIPKTGDASLLAWLF